ncbi:NADH-quinone oxidoreductase subunit L [Sulfurimonas sp.]|jgi:NADH-quinone oxidoreductase subunit L|uniref:NADH-quinone oxidoreductase subunit L n=1 Tax=Sulfurimonas sp. TaxID=2022749 RepID=UPI0025CE6AA9|nr:NADH-quinone oxidoreductase subunit L [Sulfurimonas sp.]MBT5934209.1 NADH-quinone oxidoreductase subunit L [Sulfurimonas sp.]
MLNIIVILPFLSAFIMAVVYLSNTKPQRYFFYTLIGVGSPTIITILSLLSAYELLNGAPTIHTTLLTWINIGEFNIDISFMADKLSVVMISFITFIATFIHIYAAGYMKDDEAYGKFFSYFNLFIGSMLLLVLADNPIMMFIGWELVGLSSYLLIGFYHTESQNITAANKAFILNRVGDFGFIMGIALLFVSLEGTGFTFSSIKENISLIPLDTLNLIGIFLFVGAMGKSAQIPLYVWLPDAMAGPTPVSALIHAATMVTAGVYMVARYSFIYEELPDVGLFIAYIGAFSALLAAIIASYQSDIKKILAYSTMSQLGYMFIAVGLGAYSSGIFHVFTHAFFKALLFMGAGGIIIALHHEQNIFKMGGLKKQLKLVYITMFIATLAISGIPPFAGFFSKDAILMTTYASEHYLIWIMATFTAGLTAFYMFRLFFSVFHATPKEPLSVHSLDKSITYPLIVLAFGSATAGFLGVNAAYGGDALINNFLALPDRLTHISHSTEYLLGGLNVLLALSGMLLAYKMFAATANEPIENTFFSKLIINKFYVDEFYVMLIVKPIHLSSHLIANFIDPKIIDGFISIQINTYTKVAVLFSKLQNGQVRYYALYILTGLSLMSCYMIYKLGVI